MDKLRTILMVEDDENHVIINKRKIVRSGIPFDNFVSCESVECAKDEINKNKVDLILLDLNLTDCKGPESVLRIREFYNGLLIILTSMDQEVIGVQCIRNGADEFLVKSDFTEKVIYEKVLYGMEKRKREARMASVEFKLDLAQKIGEGIGK